MCPTHLNHGPLMPVMVSVNSREKWHKTLALWPMAVCWWATRWRLMPHSRVMAIHCALTFSSHDKFISMQKTVPLKSIGLIYICAQHVMSRSRQVCLQACGMVSRPTHTHIMCSPEGLLSSRRFGEWLCVFCHPGVLFALPPAPPTITGLLCGKIHISSNAHDDH